MRLEVFGVNAKCSPVTPRKYFEALQHPLIFRPTVALSTGPLQLSFPPLEQARRNKLVICVGVFFSPQVRKHLLLGLQHGWHVSVCIQQHRDGAHLQTRDCEREVSLLLGLSFHLHPVAGFASWIGLFLIVRGVKGM